MANLSSFSPVQQLIATSCAGSCQPLLALLQDTRLESEATVYQCASSGRKQCRFRNSLKGVTQVLATLSLVLAAYQLSLGQGFNQTPINWVLPAGGYNYTGHNSSYNALAYATYTASTSDNSWAVQDMNGDSRPDLLVLTETNGTFNEPFGTTATGRYWKVYLNTGTGYATTATSWALPAGGYIATGSGHLFSFNSLAYEGTAYTGNQGWAVRDMNGDAKPDLVVLTEGNGIYSDPFGTTATGRYWKVYLNTGTGFAATATNWGLPAGGYATTSHDFSYGLLEYMAYSNSPGTAWSVRDMNADAKPDLVVLSDDNGVFGTGTTGRYWKVYLNTGAGFATTATAWALPAGGHIFISGGVGGGVTYYLSFDALAFSYSSSSSAYNSWATQDMNGDKRPDLVVLTEGNGTYNEPFGTTATGRYWKVYLNTGTGFATTATNWSLPAGGYIDASNGHLYSFNWISATGSNLTGNQRWQLQDLNGDAKPELVILAEGTGTANEVFGTSPAGRYWKVYANTGTGYATTPTSWALPAGGRAGGSFDDLAYAGSYTNGTQGWSVLDFNGDAKADLVVFSEGTGFYQDAFGTGATGRYWKVYFNSATGLATRSALGISTLEMFPNPARHAFTLRLPSLGTERMAQLTLFNNLGQVLQTRSLELRPGGTDTQMDVSALAAGLYTVRVQAGGQTAAQQVVVE